MRQRFSNLIRSPSRIFRISNARISPLFSHFLLRYFRAAFRARSVYLLDPDRDISSRIRVGFRVIAHPEGSTMRVARPRRRARRGKTIPFPSERRYLCVRIFERDLSLHRRCYFGACVRRERVANISMDAIYRVTKTLIDVRTSEQCTCILYMARSIFRSFHIFKARQ